MDALTQVRTQVSRLCQMHKLKRGDRCQYIYPANSSIPLYLQRLSSTCASRLFVHSKYLQWCSTNKFLSSDLSSVVHCLNDSEKMNMVNVFRKLDCQSDVSDNILMLLPYSKSTINKLLNYEKKTDKLLIIFDFDYLSISYDGHRDLAGKVNDCRKILINAGWIIYLVEPNNLEVIIRTIENAKTPDALGKPTVVLVKTGLLQMLF